MELSKQQKLQALNYALDQIKIEKNNFETTEGICFHLLFIIKNRFKFAFSGTKLKFYMPELKTPNSSEFNYGYWWEKTDFNSRITYLENLIKQIKNDKTK